MNSNQGDRLTEIFFGACDLHGEERAGYLDRECSGNAELRAQVERLIVAGEDLSTAEKTHLAAQVIQDAASVFAESAVPKTVGPFHILEEIGEGGMSIVYAAEQYQPVNRRVALKVIRPGMGSRDVINRFESERQALAMMDHVNIAKIFDGGTTEHGLPYFVMELVSGEPLTSYCDSHTLTIPERLELFCNVCSAVQHAHLKGVVHRDLKPSNILVGEQDGKPHVKVIDFGIAKALDATLNVDPTKTRNGQVMGTPTHMSPEQASGQVYAIDTRTDVYSLGVVLFQLLTGELPYVVEGMGGDAIRRSIEQGATSRPSAKIRSVDEKTVHAAERNMRYRQWVGAIEGDLDWITMRAMEVEPARRYQTVNAIATDIQHYLHARPIAARPPSATYLVGRFVRRNRKMVIAASIAVFAMLAGITLATIGMVRATYAERVAISKQRTAEKAKEFLVGTFVASDPEAARGRQVSASDLLRQGAARIDRELDDEPEIQSALLQTMGRAFENLALYDEAEPLLRRAVDLAVEAHGPDHLEVAAAQKDLGEVLWRTGQYDEAKVMHGSALDIIEQFYGREHPDYAVNTAKLGMAYFREGDYDEALTLFKQSLEIYQRLELTDSSDYADVLSDLGGVKVRQNNLDAAAEDFQSALKVWRSHYGEVHPNIATVLSNLGAVAAKQGRFDEASDYYQRALEMRRSLYGDSPHSQTAISLNNLASLYWRQSDVEQAEPLFKESLDMRRAVYGDISVAVATGLNNLALVLLARGDATAAEAAYREALKIRQVLQGEDHPNVAITQTNLAATLNAKSDFTNAMRESRQAVTALLLSLGPTHWRVASARSVYGAALAGLGEFLEAEGQLVPAFNDIRAARGDADRYTLEALDRVVNLYDEWDNPDQRQRYVALKDELAAARK
ncbi:MAG: tetratricopeptide repeat protein [Gammaproteobacteria bacterium]